MRAIFERSEKEGLQANSNDEDELSNNQCLVLLKEKMKVDE